MQRYVAFLRGINVGGHNVKMEQLREVLASPELQRIETFIASGNVIFQSNVEQINQLERQIEARLLQALGYEVATFIRNDRDVARIASSQMFKADEMREQSTLQVGLLHQVPDDETRHELVALSSSQDVLRVDGRELYWLRHGTIRETKISGPALEKRIGGPTTMRNIRTFQRLGKKYPASMT